MGSEINITHKTLLQRGEEMIFFFLLLRGQGRLEIVQCKQVKIEHTATLITLLADREVQLRPWEGNYSHTTYEKPTREMEGERTSGGRKERRGETNERKMYR